MSYLDLRKKEKKRQKKSQGQNRTLQTLRIVCRVLIFSFEAFHLKSQNVMENVHFQKLSLQHVIAL